MGGEALPAELLKAFYKHPENRLTTVYNVYGPTEATVNATYFKVPVAALESMNSVPIGQALPNYSLYIVDEGNRLQPVGIPGELHIGGAGLARGYLNNPELTAQKFIPHPFSNT